MGAQAWTALHKFGCKGISYLEMPRIENALFKSLDKDGDGQLSAEETTLPGLFLKGQRVQVTDVAKQAFSESKFEPGDRGTVLEPPEEGARNCFVLFDDGDSQKVALKYIAPIFEDEIDVVEEVATVERNLILGAAQKEEIVEEAVVERK